MTRLELGRTSRFEPQLLAQFAHTLVTSPADRAALVELAVAAGKDNAGDAVSVLPNGVDLEYFTPDDEARLPATLVFSGKMSYHANVTAAQHLVREIMPRIWAQRPDVRVWIVGKDPTREVVALAHETGDAGVAVTGTVPDIRTYLRRATLAVAPVPYGAGIQNKVLEAMACGAPVVASGQAVSALTAQDGRDLLVAGDNAEFAQLVLALLDAPARRGTLSCAGRLYVEQNHAWPQIVADLEQVYAGLVSYSPLKSAQGLPAFAL
jgi:glycosyltransferase involved in cell wall biosynthesis